ncbi:hypothetical protein ANN_07400 [Periplaneta americana]|uniref:Uncharacterized protein n=1 Tax=Periplaneta americana TaxID=6978 RepID=A0ABQ8T020_PERAM|nr:hypothetical protein ANN_07400 [Periplaneta americana]
MSPGSSTESYPAFARIGLRENPGKNLNQVTCPDRDSNPGHLVSRPNALTVTPQLHIKPNGTGETWKERLIPILPNGGWSPILYNIYERIPNLSAEQSDGITVFRISPMAPLILHRCRTDGSTEISQNFASVAQTTTYTVAMTAINPSSSFVPISLRRDVIVVHRSGEIRNTLYTHLNAIDLARDRTRNLGHRRPALYQLANQVDCVEVGDLIVNVTGDINNKNHWSARARWSWNNLESVKVRSCEAITCRNRSKFCPDRSSVKMGPTTMAKAGLFLVLVFVLNHGPGCSGNSMLQRKQNINDNLNIIYIAKERKQNINDNLNIIYIAKERKQNINDNLNIIYIAKERKQNINDNLNIIYIAKERKQNINDNLNIIYIAKERKQNINDNLNIIYIVKERNFCVEYEGMPLIRTPSFSVHTHASVESTGETPERSELVHCSVGSNMKVRSMTRYPSPDNADNFPRCKQNDPNFDACLKTAVEKAMQILGDGVFEGKVENVLVQLNNEVLQTVRENRMKLVPIVKTIILCGRQNIPLRGHRDDGAIDLESENQNEGIPSLQLLPVDPLKIEKATIEQGGNSPVNYKFLITDSELKGLSMIKSIAASNLRLQDTSFHLQFHQVRQIVPPFWFSRLDPVLFKIIGPTPVIKFDHHQLACLTLIEIDTPQIDVEDGQMPT